MVLEFCGLPGSGKTYYSQSLIDDLRKERKRAYNLTDLSRGSFLSKCVFYVYRKLILCTIKSRGVKKQIRSILRDSVDKTAKYNVCSIEAYISSIVVIQSYYRFLSRSKTVFILDEGVVQQFANIVVNFGATMQEIGSIMRIFSYHPNCFYIDASIDTAISSVINRNRHVCYIDELKDERLSSFMEAYNYALVSLHSLIICELSRDSSAMEIVGQIKYKLFQN